MEYRAEGRIESGGVGGRTLLVFGLGLMIFGAAWLGGQASQSASRSPTSSAISPAARVDPASPAPRAETMTQPRPAVPNPPQVRLPPTVGCRGIGMRLCHAAILAAVRALGPADPPIAEAIAWPSLLCSDSGQCPRAFLTNRIPVGSVTLTFAESGAGFWLNVFGREVPKAEEELDPARLNAYVVWWLPGPVAQATDG